ncbi:MAG: SurA N-terminal domain-containing protein [Deltaproteobacteria bacterium]|nr:SurA N-terminal domain-containing protein [Deltaproteobacteria bacterium]
MARTSFFRIWVFFIALSSMTAVSSFGTETRNRVVAIVNNQIITLHELNNTIKELTGHSAEDLKLRNEEQFLDARRQILTRLMDEKIAEEKIKELNIKVGDRQIDAAIEKIKLDYRLTQEDLLTRLEQDELTYEKFRQRIKAQIERAQLIDHEVKSKIIISDEDIAKYYEQNASSFGREAEVHLASIFLMRKNPDDPREMEDLMRRGEEILARLKTGEGFAQVAKKFSEGPGADEGGDLGTFRWGQLDPEARRVLEGIQEGECTDLLVRPNGIQIIKILEKQGGEERPLEDVSDAIYEVLYRQEVDRRYNEWIEGLRKSSYTRIIF